MARLFRRLPTWLQAWLPVLAAALLLQPHKAQTQLPSPDELAVALATSAPAAQQSGLVWRTHLLWIEALRQRSPLVAAHHQGVCHLGFTAYTPGRDFGWLFPALSPSQRAVWLAGVVHHELAHCADHASSGAAGQGQVTSAHQQEVLADLAFALHVDAAGADGAGLVALLATLRSSQAAADPVHDTASALRCYLHLRGSFHPTGDWLARLQAWRQQCSAPPTGAPDSPQVASAWAGPGDAQSNAPQPVATRR
jgi:hypothetical protein